MKIVSTREDDLMTRVMFNENAEFVEKIQHALPEVSVSVMDSPIQEFDGEVITAHTRCATSRLADVSIETTAQVLLEELTAEVEANGYKALFLYTMGIQKFLNEYRHTVQLITVRYGYK